MNDRYIIRFKYICQDSNRMEIAIKEALEYYGNKKTDRVIEDSKGIERDIRFISLLNKVD